MDVRKYGGQVETLPTEFDCRSLFTKAFFCNSFIPKLWSRMAVNLRSNGNATYTSNLGCNVSADCRQLKTTTQWVGNSHTVIDYQGSWEAHDVRDRHEGNKLRQVHKQLWGHPRELVDEGSSHCFHGLHLSLRGLTRRTKARDKTVRSSLIMQHYDKDWNQIEAT